MPNEIVERRTTKARTIHSRTGEKQPSLANGVPRLPLEGHGSSTRERLRESCPVEEPLTLASHASEGQRYRKSGLDRSLTSLVDEDAACPHILPPLRSVLYAENEISQLKPHSTEARPFEPRASLNFSANSSSALDFEFNRPSFMRTSAEVLEDLRALHEDELLVMLTPVVRPWESCSHPIDPFEPLGKALSVHHGAVRHIPYMPYVGLVDIHEWFIQEAAALIVVVCEDSEDLVNQTGDALYVPDMDGEAAQQFLQQMSFTRSVRKKLDKINKSMEDVRTPTPLIIVAVGPSGGMLSRDTSLFDYDTILYCDSYEPLILQDAAKILWSGDESTHEAAPQYSQTDHLERAIRQRLTLRGR